MITKTKTVLAKHRWRKNGDGSALMKSFTMKAWKLLPSDQHEGKTYPKAGYVEVNPDSLKTPPEAEAVKEKPKPASKPKAKPASKPKAKTTKS